MNREFSKVLEDAWDAYPDALILIDRDLTPTRANQTAMSTLALPRLPDSSFDAQALARLLGGESGASSLLEAMNRALAGSFERLDLPRERGPGGCWWLTLRIVPVRSPDGRIESLMVRVREVSTQERVEEALVESQHKLRLSEAELRSMLDTSPDLVICYNRDIEILYSNQEAQRAYQAVLGVELRPGLRTYDLFPSELRPYWDRVNARVLAGVSFVEEFRCRGVDGRMLIYEVSYQPMRDGSRVIGFTTFGRNVTAQRRQEEALRQAQKLESLGVLAGGVAHDFNNLLAAMLGNLELARRKGLATDVAAGFLGRLESAILRATDLTRQMLVYAGRGAADVRLVDLSVVVDQIANLLEVSIPKTVSLRLNLGEALPPIQADAGHLQQVVMNLVINAAEAIGGLEGTVRVTTALVGLSGEEPGTTIPGHRPAAGPHVMLEVADTGAGMEPELVSKIFDPFFSTKAEGRGLGLSSLLGILRIHRAGLLIETEPGRGSTFRIYFPLAQDARRAKSNAPPVMPASPSGLILVADDEPWVLDVMSAALEAFGYQVLRARDGAEAVELFEAQSDRVAMVVLDASMPKMGGAEALARIRARSPGTAALLCSGYGEREVIDGQHDAPTRFLQKPFTMTELASAVNELLGDRTE